VHPAWLPPCLLSQRTFRCSWIGPGRGFLLHCRIYDTSSRAATVSMTFGGTSSRPGVLQQRTLLEKADWAARLEEILSSKGNPRPGPIHEHLKVRCDRRQGGSQAGCTGCGKTDRDHHHSQSSRSASWFPPPANVDRIRCLHSDRHLTQPGQSLDGARRRVPLRESPERVA